jgi:UDP-N-acetylglucosamine pyrophosphorylase
MEPKVDQSPEFELKMEAIGVARTAIRAFKHNYQRLVEGDSGLIRESDIEPVTDLPRLEQIQHGTQDPATLLKQAVVIKLNGGLGTSMGLERAKSLLVVKDKLTFLDFIVRQILHLQEQYQRPLSFVLMNSFSTSRDTLEFLRNFPALGQPEKLELRQSQAPKVDAQTMKPVSWPDNPQLEWCPPGHGDIYPSLISSGLLERWVAAGKKFLFVSNSDNLGATLDLGVLGYFAESGKAFLMEVAERTPSDSKGGHLARRGNRLLLRESAQCPKEDQASFQDIRKHLFFNTNNLWIRLEALQKILNENKGFIPLPLIKNEKTVDPRDRNSPKVYQLETAMGAAIQCFDETGGLVVPRSRFAPVKTTADLFALRSDAYQVTKDWRIVLNRATGQAPPTIDLDPNFYKLVDQLDEATVAGVPSLVECEQLSVRGPVSFHSGNVFRGKVSIQNTGSERKPVPPGVYADCSKSLT